MFTGFVAVRTGDGERPLSVPEFPHIFPRLHFGKLLNVPSVS